MTFPHGGRTPLLSVVMAVYNGERYLKDAIDSILNQTFTDFEFVVVDDGSTDATRDLLEHYRHADDRMQVTEQPHRGLVDSLNRGCGLARGRFIARMDADDVAVRDRFERQIRFMEGHPRVAVLGGAVRRIHVSGQPTKTTVYPTTHTEIVNALSTTNPVEHAAVVMRADAFSALGGYRRGFVHAQDYDLWLRMSEHYELANLPEIVLYYRIHPAQISSTRVRQQVISVFGARLSAEMRRNGSTDVFEGIDEVTAEVLCRLGVDEAAIQRSTVGAYLRCARLLHEGGHAEAALNAIREAKRAGAPPSSIRPAVAAIYRRLAKFLRLSGGQDARA